MCIICNLPPDKIEVATEFLSAFSKSSTSMEEAAKAMLSVSLAAASMADRKRYDRLHKRMVKLKREWNALEHVREADGNGCA